MSESSELRQLLAEEAHRLNPTALIELFELDATPAGDNSILYFHNGSSGLRQPIRFKGVVYEPMPIQIRGVEISGGDKPPRPTLTISNIGGFMSALVLSTDDLTGAVLTRRTTYARFLDGMPDAAEAEFDPDIFIVERKTIENRERVEFELGTGLDLDGVMFPIRRVASNYCTAEYRGVGCPFVVNFVFSNEKDVLYDGAASFYGNWNAATQYVAPGSVAFNDGTYEGLYKCLSGTPISGVPNSPSAAPSSWSRVQRFRGLYSPTVTDYATNDVVYIERKGQRMYAKLITGLGGTIPPPPNSLYWHLDVCSKLIRACRYRFDSRTAGNPIPINSFPGTLNLPTQ